MFTIKGYTVNTREQAESILVMAILQGDKRIAEQCKAVIAKLSN